jgi:mono/diheme cytochrome c family protein
MNTYTFPLLAAATLLAGPAWADDALVKRGRYLLEITDCRTCHTPMKLGANGPEPDLSRNLAGHPQELRMPPAPAMQAPWGWSGALTNTAFAGPWGVSFAANLTADKETGLGNWREQDFIRTLRSGRHAGAGRPILPPMPWPAYKHMTDADLKALFAYLKTVPPIRNKVPEPLPPAAVTARKSDS